MSILKQYWIKSPLALVLFVGLVLRLLAAVFAQGYLMHDDHFLVIEAAASWAHGTDYNHWLPWTPGNNGPEGHSFFYVGLHYLLFEGFLKIGLEDPKIQMLIIRVLHAFYSLLTILLGYKITLKLGNRQQARLVGLILAMLFFFPNFAVRNLVEMVCIPPLLASIYFLVRDEDSRSWRAYVIAGIFGGIAVGIRYQAGLIPLGIGLTMLIFRRNLKGFLIYGSSSLIVFFLTQGADLYIWKRPFAELTEYISYNIEHSSTYLQSAPYMYLLTIGGALIPPISLFLIFGCIRNWKKLQYLVIPSLLFLIIHSTFLNKQERFILPIIPLLIIAGVIGWFNFTYKSKFWQKRTGLHSFFWGWFWVINTLLLAVATFSYGKRARVEAMHYVYEQGAPNFAIEYSFRDEIRYPPQYYSGYWGKYAPIDSGTDLEAFKKQWEKRGDRPAVVLFYEDDNRSERITQFNEVIPIDFEEQIEPSFLDQTLHDLNPNNRIERVHIYRILWEEL